MQDTIQSREIVVDLEHLRGKHGGVVLEIYDALDWELFRADDFKQYSIVEQDIDEGFEYRAVVSAPAWRGPQLVMVFGFEVFDGTKKVLLIGIKEATQVGAVLPTTPPPPPPP